MSSDSQTSKNIPLSTIPSAQGKQQPSAPQVVPSTPQFLGEWWQAGSNKKRLVNLWGSEKEARQAFVTALQVIQRNPNLAKCTQSSLIGCILQAAEVKLSPATSLAECAFVPRNGQATFTVMYPGILKHAYNAGLKFAKAGVVYERDQFDFDEASTPPILHHRRALKDRGTKIAAWAKVILPSGAEMIEVMSIDEVDLVRTRSAASSNGPWVTDYDQMARKTVLKRLLKYVPKSSEVMSLIADEEHNNKSLAGPSGAIAQSTFPDSNHLEINYETGEVLTDVTET
jgi:phage RecT family recombinase